MKFRNAICNGVLVALAFFLIAVNVRIASAQIAAGSMSGRVKDQTGATNDANGLYAFPDVAVGQYELDITHTGFKPYKRTGIMQAKVVQFRLESFNVFNHTHFFGPTAVNGDVDNALFGHVVNAAPPRLIQLALKFAF